MSISTKHQSLGEFMDSAWGKVETLAGLDAVVGAIADGARKVHQQVQAAALADALGTTGEINVQGEVVQRLDAAGSDIFVDVLKGCGRVAAIGCEEIEGAVLVGDGDEQPYIVQMDPVDGSSNIDVAVTIGSIFGIWRRQPGVSISEDALLRPGSEQVAAAYVVYGSSTVLVTATPASVNAFTLDADGEVFLLTGPDIEFPQKCEYYSTNEGNFKKLEKSTQRAVSLLRDSHSLRYVGSLVADFHRNLIKGGIFIYPSTTTAPQGKLRVLYEAFPLAYVCEAAGGAATDGHQRILDLTPEEMHARTPLFIGNKEDVERVTEVLSRGA